MSDIGRIDDTPEPQALTILEDRPTPPWLGVPDRAQFAEQARRAAGVTDGEPTKPLPANGKGDLDKAEAAAAKAVDRLAALRLRLGA